MVAASYHPRILIPKYGQMDNVKPLTANRGLPFAVRWPNLDLKISILIPDCWLPPKYWGLTSHPSSNLVKELKLLHSLWKWITNETYYQRWIFQFVVRVFLTGYKTSKCLFWGIEQQKSINFFLPWDGIIENSLLMSSQSKMPSKGKFFPTWKHFKKLKQLTNLLQIMSLQDLTR